MHVYRRHGSGSITLHHHISPSRDLSLRVALCSPIYTKPDAWWLVLVPYVADKPRPLYLPRHHQPSFLVLRPHRRHGGPIANSTDILTFQDRMQAVNARPWDLEKTYNPAEHNGIPLFGVHAGGHHTIGGDPGGDFFTSPNDPAFYAHHSGIDRMWAIWQWLDLENRTEQIAGGTFMFDPVNSPRQTLDDAVDMGVVGNKVWRIRDLVSTVDGPFCHTYE